MISILGYADKMSVGPGEDIRFMVSCEPDVEAYDAQILRLVCTDDSPDGPGRKEYPVETPISGQYAGRQQPIRIGSYVVLKDSAALDDLASFTVQALIWPTTPGHARQGLVTRWNESEGRGFALVIEDGAAALMLGNGEAEPTLVSSGVPMIANEWYRVTASFNRQDGRVRITQIPLFNNPIVNSAADVSLSVAQQAHQVPDAPLLCAAWKAETTEGGLATGGHYNGKLEAPRLANRVLDEMQMQAMPEDSTVLAMDFSQDIGSDHVTDLISNQRLAQAVNLPARAVTGHNWTGDCLSWQECPDQYGAIHFHDDDLADAGWQPDFTLTVPEDMASGVYAARLECESSVDYVPFVVRPKLGAPTAPVAFLLSAATYTAYANTRLAISDPMDEIQRGALYELFEADLYLQAHPELGLSLYDNHFDGSPVFFSSRLRPVLNNKPGTRLWNFNADMMVVDWLTAKGIAHDVITDEDLDRDGLALLSGYRAVVTGSHPEYVSETMMGAFESYLSQGGRVAYLGGNGFYWQTAFHPQEPGIVEVRKSEGVRNSDPGPGQRAHAFDGKQGGLWRNRGRGVNWLLGVGTTAFGFDTCGHFRRTDDSFDPRAAFIFEGIGAEEVIGNFGLIGDGAAGVEIDRMDRTLGSPAHALRVAHSAGLSRCYLPSPEELYSLHPAMGGDENPEVRADMVFFETPNGGAVFSTGSIAWATSLCHQNYNNNVSRITENVLNRFMEKTSRGGPL